MKFLQSNPVVVFIMGGAVGVLLAHSFLMNFWEQLAFKVFWENLGNPQGRFPLKEILQSTTFWKSIVSFGLAGYATMKFVESKLKAKPPGE